MPSNTLSRKISQSYIKYWSRDSSVGIATGYGLGVESRVPAVQDFSLLQSVHTGLGSVLRGKAAGT
jgi:hypothetical protein